MISMMAPAEHFRPDGSVARERLSSAGRPAPLVTVAIMDGEGRLLPPGERGEIVIRSSLVMAGYYKDPAATPGGVPARLAPHRRHRLPGRGELPYSVDRAKDMIITGGFNVYSAEVEQALMAASRRPGLRGHRAARRQVGGTGHRRAAASSRAGRGARGAEGLRQGEARQRQDAEADRDLAGSAPVPAGQGTQRQDQGPDARGAERPRRRLNQGEVGEAAQAGDEAVDAERGQRAGAK